MENNESVKIFARMRPTKSNSPIKAYFDIENSTDQMLILERNIYRFDQIFYQSAKNEEIFDRLCKPNVEKLINGFNSCALAYGASGSGKTFTMGLGQPKGMIQLTIQHLFESLDEKIAKQSNVSVSYVEIYNEKVYDLLSEKCSSDSIYTKGTKYNGSTKVSIKSTENAIETIMRGNKNRHIRSTAINKSSSRSHAIFTINLSITTATNNEIRSVLHLVDLAGSEGVRNTNHIGIAQQEGVNINQGLLAVGKVVQAMSTSKKLIPFRDSVLTIVLQDCLNCNSFFTLLACISPARKDRAETLSTIRFAQSCKVLNSKILPEANLYLKEQERLSAKTPLKSYMIPFARNELQKGKTPMNSQKRYMREGQLESIKKRNCGTVEKQPSVLNANRFNSFVTPRPVAIKLTPMRHTDVHEKVTNYDTFSVPHSSDTFNLMNASTSTEVGESSVANSHAHLAATPIPNFSPLMRRIEATIDRKLTTFMESIKNYTAISDLTQIHQNFRKDLTNEINESLLVSMEENPATEKTVLRVDRESSDSVIHFTAPPAKRRLMTCDLSQDLSQNEKVNVQPRRSVRLAVLKATRENKNDKKVKVIDIVESPKRKARKLKNAIITSYQSQGESSLKNVTKKDHCALILNILNTGSIKDLQMIQTIGSKTAYQIVIHRAVKGKFLKLEEVKEGLKMKDNAWNKFLEKNLLN